MIAALTFAKPEWLLLLVILPVIGFASWLAWVKRGDRWKKLVAERLRSRLTSRRPAWTHFLALGLALTGVAGLITAFAEPESGEEWIEIQSEGRNILFCIDISRSMLTADIEPNRLMAARAAALEILERFPTDRVGILLFSGDVLVQAPLTIDHSFVEDSLAQLTPNDIPNGGSNLTDAVNKGVKMLVETNQRNNIMVVFSDGEKSSANLEAAADYAKTEGVFIYALGMGKEGGFIPDPRQADGKFRDRSRNPVFSKLDEEALQTLAERTDGVYSRGIGRGFLSKLDAALAEMDRFEEESRHQRVAKPAHTWFLFGGLLLLMSSVFVRCLPLSNATRAAAVLAACFTMSMPRADAGLISDGKAALEDNDPAAAYRAFHEAAEESTGERAANLHLAAGTAAYEAKQWNSAADSFSAALATLPSDQVTRQEQAHYSLANSLYYLGGTQQNEQQIKAWKGAVEHYQHAIELSDDPTQAQENKAIVEELIKKQKEQQKKQEEKDQQKPEDSKKSEDEKKSEDKKDSENSEKSDKSDQPPEKDPKSEEKNKDEQSEKSQQSQDGDNKQKGKEGEPKDPSEEDQNSKEGGQPQDQKNPKPGEEGQQGQEGKEGEQGKENEDQNQQAQPPSTIDKDNPPRENETPQQRARRLLRQYADFGGKAPRYIRRPPRRAAQDW